MQVQIVFKKKKKKTLKILFERNTYHVKPFLKQNANDTYFFPQIYHPVSSFRRYYKLTSTPETVPSKVSRGQGVAE